jgi:hypothetical protein
MFEVNSFYIFEGFEQYNVKNRLLQDLVRRNMEIFKYETMVVVPKEATPLHAAMRNLGWVESENVSPNPSDVVFEIPLESNPKTSERGPATENQL